MHPNLLAVAVPKLELIRETMLEYFTSCRTWLIEMKINQEVNNRLTREFQRYACEGRRYIKGYYAHIGCDGLHKLPGVGNAVL